MGVLAEGTWRELLGALDMRDIAHQHRSSLSYGERDNLGVYHILEREYSRVAGA
jgi:hypothetical protein